MSITFAFEHFRRLLVVLVLTTFVSSACKTEYAPNAPGETGKILVEINGGPVNLQITSILPSAVATLSPTDRAELSFTTRCSGAGTATVRWGFLFLRDDDAIAVFQAVGCPQTVPLQAIQTWTFRTLSSEYAFAHGHTIRLRLAVAASADALMNGGPYVYFGTRDIATWTILD